MAKFQKNNKELWVYKAILAIVFMVLVAVALNFIIPKKIPVEKTSPLKSIKNDTLIDVRVTTYTLWKNKTKFGKKINPDSIYYYRWCAMSTDLMKRLNIKGLDTIEITSPFCFNGRWIVVDITDKSIKNTVDILKPLEIKGNLWNGILKF